MFDIQIQPGNARVFTSLDLEPGTSISIEDHNPFFAKEIFPGTFSMPINVPLTGRNQKAFGFADNLHRSGGVKVKYPARIFGEGLPLLEGEVILRSTSKKGYRINFQGKISLLGEKFNNIKLAELVHTPHVLLQWDGEAQPFSSNNGCKFLSIGVLDLANLPNPISLTINEAEFTSIETEVNADRLADICTKISAAPGLQAHYTPNPLLAGEGVMLRIQTTSPGLDVPLQVKADQVWEYQSSWFDVYDTRIRTAISQLVASPPDFTFFPTFRNPTFFKGGKVQGASDHNLLKLDGTAFEFSKTLAGEEQIRAIVPMYQNVYITEKIRETTGVDVVFLSHYPELAKLMLFNTNSINFFENIFNDKVLATYANVINPGDHMPDLTINEYLLNLKGLFGAASSYDPDISELNLHKLNGFLTGSNFADFTSKSDPAYDIEFKEEPGITIGYKTEEGEPTEAVVLGSGLQDFRSEIYPVPARIVKRENSQTLFKIPVLDEEGGWYGKKQSQKFRIALYAGIVADAQGGKFIQASQDNTLLGGVSFNDVSLEMDWPTGIYEQYLQKQAEIYAYNEPMKRVLYWNMADLLQFDYSRKYRIDQVNYMVRKLSYSISSRSGLQPVQAEVVRVD